ncbi:hypothetical protein MSAN_02305000 [Mycena sanguinolenta]|uniref:Uncharacterized protein n=1 Tax=Mycena sanguinolenta TaxID=230812 RepID=A0A8H6X8Q2_9AGAR|nr:hypothetical protein MSAN_02305000 [Mycena sanguinolenta]
MSMASIFKEIKSFRLGYSEERPYPWRWTTPIVLCAFFFISPFLAVVNIPLSAYNVIQEFTYQPNNTLPAGFLANIVPSVLQNPTDSFTPQLLNVGDMIALDNHIFNHTISEIFDGVNKTDPVPAFPYYNNPLSDSCDVANITVQLLLNYAPRLSQWAADVQFNPTPPPMRIADLLAQGPLWNISSSELTTAYQNLIQTLYHLVRVDLGVILDNQIYNSPEMFNRSISPLDVEVHWPSSANTTRNLAFNATLMAQWQQEVEFFQNNTRVPPLEYLRFVPRLKPLGSAVTSVFVSTFAMLSVMWTVFSLVAGALARKHSAPNDTLGKKDTLDQSRTWEKRLESGVEEVDESEVILLVPRKEPDAVERLKQEGMQMRVSIARMRAALIKHGIMEDEDWLQEDDTTVE